MLMLMRIRLRLARLICPELRPRPVRDDKVVNFFDAMDSTTINLCLLIKAFAEFTNRSPLTVSRLATGSGVTLRRLEEVKADGSPAHRISTDRAHRAITYLSTHWPIDLEWPRRIPRPPKKKKESV